MRDARLRVQRDETRFPKQVESEDDDDDDGGGSHRVPRRRPRHSPPSPEIGYRDTHQR